MLADSADQVAASLAPERGRAATLPGERRHRDDPPGLPASLRVEEVEDERLLAEPGILLALLPASGVLLRAGGRQAGAGALPEPARLEALLAWLAAQPSTGLLALDHLPPEAPWAGALLAVTIGRAPGDLALWLRADPQSGWSRAERAAAAEFRGAWLESRLAQAEARAAVREAERERQAFLAAELDHRLKNVMAGVQAMLRGSRRRAASPEGVVQDVETRLRAMAATHDLLYRRRWDGAPLRALAEQALRPYGDPAAGDRIALAGPDLMLRPQAAFALGLALQELATNAAKHGALSVASGRVALRWRRAGGTVLLRWEERDGPPAQPPTRRGFGLTVIERGLGRELGGTCRLRFPPEGLRCTIRFDAAQLAPPG
ncbi:sensor histidine kinase [Roseicella aquatilis]|nr:sensor histidine kinase [Roseicella aquatilis]